MEVGATYLIRDVQDGRVLAAFPFRLVADDGETIVTWLAPGTRCRYFGRRDGTRLKEVAAWTTEPHVWFGTGILRLKRRRAGHSVVLFWENDGSFRGWYVNLDDPLRETARGYDTCDQYLDLWIEHDGSVTWKDEDHLAEAASLGRVDGPAVRAEAELVLEAWPFPTGWEDWRPDPAWPVPELPAGWEVV